MDQQNNFNNPVAPQAPVAPTQPQYNQQAQPQYAQTQFNNPNPNQYTQPTAPVRQLKTGRGLLKFFLLNLITLGIYSIFYFSSISSDINIIASRYDGRKTMHYCLLFFIVGPITLGIATLVWFHNLSDRIGGELQRRGINYSFGAGTFWLWNVLGSLIIVGPFIYIHKLSEAMNLLSGDFNVKG